MKPLQDEVTPEEAVRFLAIIEQSERPTLSIEAKDYKRYFRGLGCKKVIIDQEHEPQYVILDRRTAIEHIRSQWSFVNV